MTPLTFRTDEMNDLGQKLYDAISDGNYTMIEEIMVSQMVLTNAVWNAIETKNADFDDARFRKEITAVVMSFLKGAINDRN